MKSYSMVNGCMDPTQDEQFHLNEDLTKAEHIIFGEINGVAIFKQHDGMVIIQELGEDDGHWFPKGEYGYSAHWLEDKLRVLIESKLWLDTSGVVTPDRFGYKFKD